MLVSGSPGGRVAGLFFGGVGLGAGGDASLCLGCLLLEFGTGPKVRMLNIFKFKCITPSLKKCDIMC